MIDFKRLCPNLAESEICALEESRTGPVHRGAIFNPQRLDSVDFQKRFCLEIDEKDPFLFRFSANLGKTVECLGGAFYIMDPSATLVSRFLPCVKNEIVLDLCAAPGGKTISYAVKHPESLIIANDISSSRLCALRQNIERMGLCNVIVTNHEPAFFVRDFTGFFDKVILDTPCSGSGMYRKEKEVEKDFSFEKLARLLPLQKSLLATAGLLVKEGGYLSYSTCSFSPLEDEDQIVEFTASNRDFSELVLPDENSFYRTQNPGIYLFPTRFRGEGQYICILKKAGLELPNPELRGRAFTFQKREYFLAHYMPNLEKLQPNLPGVLLRGEKEKGAYSHAYARTLTSYPRSVLLSEENQALDYLHGDELTVNAEIFGEVLVRYQLMSLGWGKVSGHKLKNYLPKGIRLISR